MDFTPALYTGGGERATTIDDAVFTINDGWVHGHCKITATTTGFPGLAITAKASEIPLPLDANAGNTIGWFKYTRGAVDHYAGSVTLRTDGFFEFYADDPTSTSELGISPSFANTSGDSLAFTFTYRHA